MPDTNYSDYDQTDEGQSPRKRTTINKLIKYAESDNVAELLTPEKLEECGQLVRREYDVDKGTQAEWEDNNEEAMKLAMQVAEEKTYPWPKAANVKYPLLTTAAIQFAARAYPAILGKGDPVKGKVNGYDDGITEDGQQQPQMPQGQQLPPELMSPDLQQQGMPGPAQSPEQAWKIKPGAKRERADRVGRHMSWQLTEEMIEWEEDTDKLLHILPIAGLVYRKTYYSPEFGRNKSELVLGQKLVINSGAKSLSTVPRATHEFELYPIEIKSRERSGLYLELEIGDPPEAGDDKDAPHEYLEQHRRLDLDEDGYAEPYIVIIHKETSQVARIIANYDLEDVAFNERDEIARIDPIEYFTKYSFLPNPTGEFHDIGFGYLLRPINEAVNSTLNQMLDAGHLAVVGGGFIGSGARIRGGRQKFRPGEFKPVDVSGASLKDNIVPLPFPGPNAVLFQLLGLLIDAGKDISAVKDVMTGENQSANQSPTTTLALIEQGMQVFTAIYKRVYRSLASEYKKLYNLNSKYLAPDSYFNVLDKAESVSPDDYNTKDFDVVPVADPNVVTNMQRLARAEYLGTYRDDPMMNGKKIRERMLSAAGIEDYEDLFAEPAPPPPDPIVAQLADEIDIKKRELALKEIALEGELAEREAKTLKLLAEAEGVEPGQQMAAYKQLMGDLNQRAKLEIEQSKIDQKGQQERPAPPMPEGLI